MTSRRPRYRGLRYFGDGGRLTVPISAEQRNNVLNELPTSFWTAFDSALAEAADTGTKQEVWWEDVDRLQCEALELEAQQFSPNTYLFKVSAVERRREDGKFRLVIDPQELPRVTGFTSTSR